MYLFPITDPHVHLRPGWASHVQSDGSNIGGIAPLRYGMAQGLPRANDSALFYAAGSSVPGGYADCEFYISRPILPNTGNLDLDISFAVDANHAENAQALEIDTILCIGGYNYNGSLQINNAEGGMVQIAKADGGWVDTGFKVSVAPDVAHQLSVAYQFDAANRLMSVATVTFDGTKFTVPSELRGVPAQQKGWKDGAILQVQLDLNAKAGQFSLMVDEAEYTWW